ncbi:MAG: hypothetical protein ACNA7E_02205 [Wenzhouxiangellaceae bacterium]
MTEKRDHRDLRARWPLRAIAASLALHAVLAVVVVNLSGDRAFVPQQPPTIRVQLLPPQAPPATAPESPESELAHEPEPELPPPAEHALADAVPPDSQARDSAAEPDLQVAEDSESEPRPGLAAEILRTITEQIAGQNDSGHDLPLRQVPWSERGEAIRGLPGMRGWLSAHVGPVTPQSDAWKENDGSSRGRYVLADGTVICTHRRAPTIDEVMNPWKSTIVTMARICGRERPAEVDYSNPRVQPPPGRAAP